MTCDPRDLVTLLCLGLIAGLLFSIWAYRHHVHKQPRCFRCQQWKGRGHVCRLRR